MKTVIPVGDIKEDSWAKDFTPSAYCRQNYLYVQCMGCFNTRESYRTSKRKNLGSFLIIHVLEGRGMLEYQGANHVLSEGMFVLVDCRSEHSYYPAPGYDWRFEWLHFGGDCIRGYLEETSKFFKPVCSDGLEESFRRIMELAGGNGRYSSFELDCSTAVINFCTGFLHEIKADSKIGSEELPDFVKEAVVLFEERFSERLSLEAVCSELNVSKYYFCRVFKEYMGCSPYEYLINLRLNFAKTLLRSSSCGIIEISEKAGFESDSYFIALFHRREGMTPLKYRKMFTN